MKLLSLKTYISLIFSLFLLTMFNTAYAGCAITLKFKNIGTAPVNVNFSSSKVRLKNGTWKKLVNGTGPTIAPSQSETITYNAVFGCKNQRRYKINFKKGGASWNQYYPSATSFTKKTTIIVNAKAP